jgi:UDP-glucose 4-epimerase
MKKVDMNKNILVIGGAGYIGSHTVVALINAGYSVIILDNFSNSEKEVIKRLRELTKIDIPFYTFDYAEKHKLEELLDKEKINGVIHFAAYKAVAESVADPLKYYSNNVSGFINLLEVMKKCEVNNFVFSSSAAVYGNPPMQKVTEETVCNPTSPYGWSKYIDEIILRDVCSSNTKLKATALRYFNVVGSHESSIIGELPLGKPQNLLPIIVQATAGILPPLAVYGTDYDTPDGTCLRDYIHVVDLADAHVKALAKQESGGNGFNVYNIGTGQATSVLELINTFEKVNKIKVPYSLGDRRPGDPAAYYAVADKANNELNWHSTKAIDDAVLSAWEWQKTLK